MKSKQSNPFSTRFVAPGEIAWIEAAYSPPQLAQDWYQRCRRGAIIGPHGSGKSTLLEHLVPLIGPIIYRRDASGNVLAGDAPSVKDMGIGETSNELSEHRGTSDRAAPSTEQNVVWLSLRKACPASMPIPWKLLKTGSALVVDGYEQLNIFARILLVFKARRQGIGLLMTSHGKTWLPTLCKLQVTPGLAKQITERLVSDVPTFKVPTEPELETALHRHHGNFREVLMELYDEFEERRR